MQNHLADVLSRNPNGLTDKETTDLTKPDQIMVHHIKLYKDKELKKELQTLGVLEDADTKLHSLKVEVAAQPSE